MDRASLALERALSPAAPDPLAAEADHKRALSRIAAQAALTDAKVDRLIGLVETVIEHQSHARRAPSARICYPVEATDGSDDFT